MSVQITNRCVSCGACIWECPANAIIPGAPTPVVLAERCTECYGHFGESQCIVVCPASAIDVISEDESALAERYEQLYGEPPSRDVWIWTRHPGVPVRNEESR
jgi:ferredoxin